MSDPETVARPAQQNTSLWQRPLWPLVVFVALPLFVLGLMEQHWLSLEGRLALIANLILGVGGGLTAILIFDRVRYLWRQRRELH
ncbi:MAG: hypothetical protein OXM54_03535 [Acidimicrobiaceae bacterium]|nr:hypothetical protein [Acidimicrobiaceae bacterium]